MLFNIAYNVIKEERIGGENLWSFLNIVSLSEKTSTHTLV